MNGLQPGPTLFQDQGDLIGVIFTAYIFANIIMYFMENGLMKFFVKVLTLPMDKLFPVILAMCVVGALTVHTRVFDCWILLLIGFFGYILNEAGFPLIPIVLGYILGTIIEKGYRTGVILSAGDPLGFLDSPIATVILVLAVLMVVVPIVMDKVKAKKAN